MPLAAHGGASAPLSHGCAVTPLLSDAVADVIEAVQELARVTAAALCAPKGSDRQWQLQQKAAVLTDRIEIRAKLAGTDLNTLLETATAQLPPIHINPREEVFVL